MKYIGMSDWLFDKFTDVLALAKIIPDEQRLQLVMMVNQYARAALKGDKQACLDTSALTPRELNFMTGALMLLIEMSKEAESTGRN